MSKSVLVIDTPVSIEAIAGENDRSSFNRSLGQNKSRLEWLY